MNFSLEQVTSLATEYSFIQRLTIVAAQRSLKKFSQTVETPTLFVKLGEIPEVHFNFYNTSLFSKAYQRPLQTDKIVKSSKKTDVITDECFMITRSNIIAKKLIVIIAILDLIINIEGDVKKPIVIVLLKKKCGTFDIVTLVKFKLK